jgi:hypothetical protein
MFDAPRVLHRHDALGQVVQLLCQRIFAVELRLPQIAQRVVRSGETRIDHAAADRLRRGLRTDRVAHLRDDQELMEEHAAGRWTGQLRQHVRE